MKRIQRKITKGWKMPPNTVYVGRPSKWGNPYSTSEYSLKESLERFKEYALDSKWSWLSPLIGKDLACWCPLDKPCHADILIELIEKP